VTNGRVLGDPKLKLRGIFGKWSIASLPQADSQNRLPFKTEAPEPLHPARERPILMARSPHQEDGVGKLRGHRREPTVVGGNVHDDHVVVISEHREELPKLRGARFLTPHPQELNAFGMTARQVDDIVVHRRGLGAKIGLERLAVERYSARDIVTP